MDKSLDEELGALLGECDHAASAEQFEEWVKEAKGNPRELLKLVIENCAPDNHLVLLKMPCTPNGHGKVEIIGAHCMPIDILEMLTGGLQELVKSSLDAESVDTRFITVPPEEPTEGD